MPLPHVIEEYLNPPGWAGICLHFSRPEDQCHCQWWGEDVLLIWDFLAGWNGQLLLNSYFSVDAHGTPFGEYSVTLIAHSYLPEACGNPD